MNTNGKDCIKESMCAMYVDRGCMYGCGTLNHIISTYAARQMAMGIPVTEDVDLKPVKLFNKNIKDSTTVTS